MMKQKHVLVFLAFIAALCCSPAKSQIVLLDPDDFDGVLKLFSNPQGHLYRDEGMADRFSFDVQCSDPNNNLSGNYDFELRNDSSFSGTFFQFPNSGSNQFTLNCKGTGKNFSENLNLSPAGLDAVNNNGGSPFSLGAMTAFTGSNDPGFQVINFSTSTCIIEGSSGGGSTPPADPGPSTFEDLLDLLDSAEPPTTTIDINDLINDDTGDGVALMVDFTYKVPTNLYNVFVGALPEDQNITDLAKELAEQFGVKLNMRNLRRLANQEVRAAGRGLRGEEKEAAENAARNSGLSKLVETIVGKLPPLPSTQTNDAEERERLRTIRKARKKNILDALEVELTETSAGTGDNDGQTCLSFKITLPANVCPNNEDSDSQTLVIAGQAIKFAASDLKPGESITADIPIKVVGAFKKFFGTANKKGKKNGKTTLKMTITNPASE